jgi:hypothetical protein
MPSGSSRTGDQVRPPRRPVTVRPRLSPPRSPLRVAAVPQGVHPPLAVNLLLLMQMGPATTGLSGQRARHQLATLPDPLPAQREPCRACSTDWR